MLQDKNEILARMIMGEATEEECRFLKENCALEELAEIMDSRDLAVRYRIYDSIDEENAFSKAKDILIKEETDRRVSLTQKRHHTLYLSLLRAAAVVLLIIAGAGYWWYRNYTKVTPPEISQDVLAAIETSKQRGKSEARIQSISTEKHLSMIKNGSFSDEMIHLLLKKVGTEEMDETGEIAEGQLSDEKSLDLITTLHDKEFWLTMDDGTLVHLNSSSRIIYPEKFSRNCRDVILSGEAYFMVAKDKSRPFIVHTPQGDVRVYGTEFYVNTRARNNRENQGNSTSVVLVKGSVGVTPSGGTEFMLSPGQQLVLKENAISPYISNVDLKPFIAWNTKKFDFDNYPLQGLMEIIYRWYNLDYDITDPAINNTLVSGSISRYDSIEPLLHAISKITGYSIHIKNNTIYINY